ncbi:MAG: hypothetical protein KH064_03970, partial [Collinsella sp.]|nr:hypothetical protein [Collinsella sp.]
LTGEARHAALLSNLVGFRLPDRPSFAVFGVRKIVDALVKKSGDYFNFSLASDFYPYFCVFLPLYAGLPLYCVKVMVPFCYKHPRPE